MLTGAELVWLLAAVAKGDEAAFERLYLATRAKLYGVVLRILRKPELADEVIQETYLKIWRGAGGYNPGLASPITWMVTIARNAAFDLIRKKRDISIEDEPQALEVSAELRDPLAQRMMREELKRLLACIDASCCSPITMVGAASSWRRNSTSRRIRSRRGCGAA